MFEIAEISLYNRFFRLFNIYKLSGCNFDCMNRVCFFLLLVNLFFSGHHATAQPGWNELAFRKMQNEQRYRFVHDYPFWKINDGAALTALLNSMLQIARQNNDTHTSLAVTYYYCKVSAIPGVILPKGLNSVALLRQLEKEAKDNGYMVEELVARHYLNIDLNNHTKLTTEQRYINTQKVFDEIEAVGFERFNDYYIDEILLNFAMFMWEMGDEEKALHYLTIAERFILQTEEGAYCYTQVLSYLQTYWKKRGQLEKSLDYAYKILQFHQQFTSTNTMRQWWNRFWLGFSNIEIADVLVKQGKFLESEQYADKGYVLSRASDPPVNEVINYQAELDALLLLIETKIKLEKFKQTDTLLKRALYLTNALKVKNELDYFKPLRLYEYLATYEEHEGRAQNALKYARMAQHLQDSLTRKNDAYLLAQAQQKFDTEKYTQKIASIQKEKELQKWLLNAVGVILCLVLALSYVNFRFAQSKRRQKEFELADAKTQLEKLAKDFREKSDLLDNLRQENEKLSNDGRRSEYLEQLTNATVITEDDWTHFRSIFEKVHPDFIAKQKLQNPNITPAETRLIVMEKLGLGTQEIANMLGVNKNTIHQTRLRLRRKLESS
jgi:hypothetical protein